LLECVPNFSDGRDPAVAAELQAAIRATDGVRLLDWHADRDHDRSVATFVGEPASVEAAAFAAIACAARRIDLSRQRGVHPRIGAADVCPFVALEPADRTRAVSSAHALGKRVGAELGLPVYFYGEAALRPERVALPDVRRGGFEGLARAVREDPARCPDEGPARLDPRAGAVAIGARGFLVAFNVELESADLEAARAIAREVRESNGGLAGVRALGLALATRGIVQVSLNLCAPERTGLVAVFDAVERGARARGLSIRGSELVGLAPRFALDDRIARHVRLAGFDAQRHVLEDALVRSRTRS
jgi:glutamate formiminotransferase